MCYPAPTTASGTSPAKMAGGSDDEVCAAAPDAAAGDDGDDGAATPPAEALRAASWSSMSSFSPSSLLAFSSASSLSNTSSLASQSGSSPISLSPSSSLGGSKVLSALCLDASCDRSCAQGHYLDTAAAAPEAPSDEGHAAGEALVDAMLHPLQAGKNPAHTAAAGAAAAAPQACPVAFAFQARILAAEVMAVNGSAHASARAASSGVPCIYDYPASQVDAWAEDMLAYEASMARVAHIAALKAQAPAGGRTDCAARLRRLGLSHLKLR